MNLLLGWTIIGWILALNMHHAAISSPTTHLSRRPSAAGSAAAGFIAGIFGAIISIGMKNIFRDINR